MRLTSELSALLSDDRYRRNAIALQARVTSEDGLSETVRIVELILGGRGPRSRESTGA